MAPQAAPRPSGPTGAYAGKGRVTVRDRSQPTGRRIPPVVLSAPGSAALSFGFLLCRGEVVVHTSGNLVEEPDRQPAAPWGLPSLQMGLGLPSSSHPPWAGLGL